MPVGLEVLAAADLNPIVFVVGGFDDGLVEIGVGDEPVEPTVEDAHVGVGEVVVPVDVAGLGDEDVGVSVQYSPLCSEMLTLPLCLEFKTKHYGKERQDRLCSCL